MRADYSVKRESKSHSSLLAIPLSWIGMGVLQTFDDMYDDISLAASRMP